MNCDKDSLGFLLADVSRLLRRAFMQRYEEGEAGGLTLAQARALVYVARHEGVRQVELAELLDIQPITLARLIDQLAEAGLVERRSDPHDRRAYRIFLRPAAGPHLAAIGRVVGAIRQEAMRHLDKSQADAALHALRTMRDNLSTR